MNANRINPVMRILFFVSFIFIAATVNAQDGQMTGIDAYFTEDGYFDDLSMALENPDEVIYLDLSLRSPKLTAIPTDVFKFKHLKYLELGFNQIGEVTEAIGALTELEVLGLDGNKYLRSVSSEVSKLPALKELHLKDTGLSLAEVEELRSKLQAGCKLIN